MGQTEKHIASLTADDLVSVYMPLCEITSLMFEPAADGYEVFVYHNKVGYHMSAWAERNAQSALNACRAWAEDYLLHKSAGKPVDRDITLAVSRTDHRYHIDSSSLPFVSRFGPLAAAICCDHISIHHALVEVVKRVA